MHAFLAWLENSGIGHAMRSSGVWTYGIVNLLHIIGVATLFGSVVILDLRMLGAWGKIPLALISRPTTMAAASGFCLAALTGLGLLATKATEYADNPFVFVKFPAIALGLVNVAVLSRSKAWKEHRSRELTASEQSKLAWMAGLSLACWLSAISAGRLIGYW